MLRAFFIINLLLLAMLSSYAGEFSGTLRVIPEYHRANQESLFFEPLHEFQELRQEFEGRYQDGGFNLLATAISTLQEKPDNELILNELYYDTVVQEMSFGKKIMSWGVGYGFRPLDVVQQEDRQIIYPITLEGVPLIAWEHFTDKAALLFAYINPLRGINSERLDEESVAFKYYYLWDNTDIHIVSRLSRRNKGEAGIGFTNIVNDNLEWHGSFLYLHRYYKRLNRLTESSSLLATDDPMIEEFFHSGINAILGFTWSHSSGISLLGEFWFDNSAYSKNEWNKLRQLTESQLRLLETSQIPESAIYSNIAASSQFFSQANLLQQNLLLRLSIDGDTIDGAIDWLLTPQDGGWVLTSSLNYELNRQRFEVGLRTFGGSSDSAFRAVTDDFISYLSWTIAFAL